MSSDSVSSFHCHTYLCKHATGTVAEYIARAAAEGASALGFSDHCPYPDDSSENWPDVRMSAAEAPSYVAAVLEGAATAPFPVSLGFECEWDRAYESWYRDGLRGMFGAQYLVLGAHWCTSGAHHRYAREISTTQELHRYIDQTIEGMRSGLFNFLAHPDLIMLGWKEWDADIESCFRTLIDAAVALNMPLEVNGLGMRRPLLHTARGARFPYPYDEFWELAAAAGARVICNSDSHCPEDVLRNARNAREYAAQFHLNITDRIF
jgi:histidinol-phosphatase (PHP family)